MRSPCFLPENDKPAMYGTGVSAMQPINFMPVEVNFRPSGKYWLAECPALDIATQGETFERAQENLKEALALFIESCLRRGTLEEVLLRAGYTQNGAYSAAKAVESYFAAHPDFVENECRA
jgi:predicted RNase H-like HicB family nuclease